MQIPILRGRDFVDSDVDVAAGEPQRRDGCCGATRIRWASASPCRWSRRCSCARWSASSATSSRTTCGRRRRRPSTPTRASARSRGLTLVLRTSVPPMSMVTAATGVIRGLDPEQPVQDIRTMVDVRDNGLTSERFRALLLASFAIVALALASVGHLQRALVHRPRPQPRDRHPRRARGADERRAAPGRARGHDAGADRHRRRRGRRPRRVRRPRAAASTASAPRIR